MHYYVLAITLALAGAAALTLARLAARGNLERNGWAGIRTFSTMASDEAFKIGNAAAAKWVRGGGLVCLATAAAMLGLGLVHAPDPPTAAAALAGVGLMLVLVCVGGFRGSRAAHLYNESQVR
jgi:hypothetical protein